MNVSEVKRLQARVGVTPDGVFGPATWAALWRALGAPPAGPAEAAPSPGGALRASPAAAKLIQQFEGCAKRRNDGTLEAYPDPGSGGDPWTIGWGSTGADIKSGTVWTQAEADARFEQHLAQFAAGVEKRIEGAATSQSQFDAMVSLAYNIGLGNFGTSTLLKKHKAGDKAGAAAEFAKWNKAAGRVLAGLTRRRAAEAALYRGRG
jgi:GH24 family phage-related lysozyme (muramidase)